LEAKGVYFPHAPLDQRILHYSHNKKARPKQTKSKKNIV